MERDFFVTWAAQEQATTLALDRAEHDELVLQDGRRIFDFLSTSFQTSFGYSQRSIIERIAAQLQTLPIASPKATFPLKERVTARLLEFLQLPAGKIFYTVSGAEAVENALKMARQVTGRPVVLARRRSYHGATLGAMSVSGDWRSLPHLNFSAGTARIPEPADDPDGTQTRALVRELGAGQIAALIVEPITGANGVIIPPASWWQAIQSLCREHGILLICDEVLNGFGRTGRNFGFHHFGVAPDLVTMSKGISGGYVPFGAVWTHPHIARYYENEVLACGLTNYAHPLGLAALDAVLDLFESAEFQARRAAVEEQFQGWLRRLASQPGIREVRSRGCLAAIETAHPAPSWGALIAAGIYAYSKERMVVLAPPLNSDLVHLAAAAERVERLLTSPVSPPPVAATRS